MPLFGKKKDNKLSMPEVLDFSNDTWSYKGDAPVYQIQSDGFSYDVVDADGNDKNAISLGLAGMIIIVLNAKNPKIKEQELLPHFGNVIKTRNWHIMTVKEANFLVQTAIKKLTSSATSGDVFDLASYAPLEVKRALLKTLFTISRFELPSEFREEAEHRIIDDIVPGIFENPDYELASLTGLIVKGEPKPDETPSLSEATETVTPADISPIMPVSGSGPEEVVSENEDSAFAELQKIYGRKTTPAPRSEQVIPVQPAEAPAEPKSQSPAPQAPVSEPRQQPPAFSAPTPNDPFSGQNIPAYQRPAQAFSTPQPNDPFTGQNNMQQRGMPAFGGPQPNDPFSQGGFRQPAMPYNYVPQPANPFAGAEPVSIPQPPAGNFGMAPGMPYGQMNPMQGGQGMPNMPMPNQGFVPGGNYPQNMQGFPPQQMQGQMPQQMPGGMPNPNMPMPGQVRPPYPQQPQNPGMYPQNPMQGQNPQQYYGQPNQGQNNPPYPNNNNA